MTDQKHNRSPDRKYQKERIKELTEKLEEGVKAVFESDRYKEYLACMSKFHNYSLNNCLLISAQYPAATAVAGYRSWQQNFGRQVRKGEKAIKILAPCKYKVETEEKDENGDPKMMELTGFRVVSVFALEQTEGKELPSIGVDELSGDVKDYHRIFNALVSISPVPVRFEEIESGAKGYYNDAEKCIAIQSGMSQLQTIKTLVHEVVHSHNHSKEALKERPNMDRKSMEVESESVAHIVLKAYNLDSEDYSIPYISSWSSGKDTKELKACMESIRSTADEMITGINRSLSRQNKRDMKNYEMER